MGSEWVRDADADARVRTLEDLGSAMGLELLETSAQRVVGRMPVAGNTWPEGAWHGGASCVLAETLASIGASRHAGLAPHARSGAVGAEINATHHGPVTGSRVTGVATRVHGGRTLAVYEIVISDEDGTRVCTARVTCLLRPPADDRGA